MPKRGNSKQSMELEERILGLVKLGEFLNDIGQENSQKNPIVETAQLHNGWFTEDNILFAIRQWAQALTRENIEKWLQPYSFSKTENKTVAIIMAGNIPLVGFHDFISVLVSGHTALVKLSSNDKILLPYFAKKLMEFASGFSEKIQFSEGKLTGFDAVIATGSNNTALHFEHYFGKYPNIIRKNRNSVAILSGEETPAQLEALAGDIFRYFGLGCRNVSKLYLPEGYDFDPFFNGMFTWKEIINNDKYINNYDYNKAVYLMSNINLLDNEFMLLKEDSNFSSPISVVFYEFYRDRNHLENVLKEKEEKIQCIVSNNEAENHVTFGKTQSPALWDYADGVDTLQFLLNL